MKKYKRIPMYKFNGYYNKYTYHKLKNESDCTFKGYPKEKIKVKNTKEYQCTKHL